MDTIANRLPTWRRPPLILVAVGLAITYAELAIETRILGESVDTIGGAGDAPCMTSHPSENPVGAFVRDLAARRPATARRKSVGPVCGYFVAEKAAAVASPREATFASARSSSPVKPPRKLADA